MRFVFLLILFIPCTILISAAPRYRQPLRIAVIDTGLDLQDRRLKGQLCDTGHIDFTGKGIKDTNGHGTHVVGLIEKYAEDSNYCIVVYKFYSGDKNNEKEEIQSIYAAIDGGASIINMSLNGPTFNEREYLAIKSHPEVKFVISAGNDGLEIEKADPASNEDVPKNKNKEKHYSYPASYFLDNEFVVGSAYPKNVISTYSNWSGNRKMYWENGTDVISTLPNDKYGKMTGTSMSAAIFTGKLIKEMLR